ncbi:MAG: 2OG-Fe(II) oxygenase [Candidatus Thiodiazotropha sp.]
MNSLTSTTGPGDSDIFDTIAAAIDTLGYIILPAALPLWHCDALYQQVRSLDPRAFHPARIGRVSGETANPFVRNDRILWVDPTAPAAEAYLAWCEQLRLAINRRLFLGLFDYECHFARYRRGAFYKKHLDAFKGERNRVLTTVYYLNPGWQPQDGGQLLLYAHDGELLETVQPQYGQMVVFLSEVFPHEVTATRRARYSLTGWFRNNKSLQRRIDPPR